MPSPSNSRKQLTLFVPEPWRTSLDALRSRLDPIQASLIPAHVTLCREDELEPLAEASIFDRVGKWAHGPLNLSFSQPIRFEEHGVLLPCTLGARAFQALRAWLLDAHTPRKSAAHITLAHPRNPVAAGNTEEELAACPRELQLKFARVALIEQQGTGPWRVLQESALGHNPHSEA